MYILKNKIRFLSIIHHKGRISIFFILFILLSILYVYSKLYLSGLLLLFILIGVKVTTMFMELNEYLDKVEYEKWLEFKKQPFIQGILMYSKYIFYPISVFVVIILLYRYYNIMDTDYIDKLTTLLMVILYLYSVSVFYINSIKLRQ